METLSTPSEVQALIKKWKSEYRIGFVPTMGCLHEGHLKLIDEAKKNADKVVVSIFVNPLQFGPGEDFERYPRAFDDDKKKCEARGVDLLFHPSVDTFYPPGFSTLVTVTGSLPRYLCGRSRPGHFQGVTTVCSKLFQSVTPDCAVFGQKDFQQLKIIEKMIADLNLPIELNAHPTVREADGLALSSRNRLLTMEQREQAAVLPKMLREVRNWVRAHPDGDVKEALELAENTLCKVPLTIDYVEIASEENLVPASGGGLAQIDRPRLFVAVKLGMTRLIDNLALYLET